MSKNCYKTSNNKYFQCPPRMDDGRHFTDYAPNCYVNNILRTNNQVYNSFQYRKFLTENADKLMDMNRTYACQKNCCGPCDGKQELPHHSEILCNNTNCSHKIINTDGIGIKVNSNSDNSCDIDFNKLPINQPYNCCADNKGIFNYYDDVDTKAQGDFSRYTSPSGGVVFSGGDPKAYNH